MIREDEGCAEKPMAFPLCHFCATSDANDLREWYATDPDPLRRDAAHTVRVVPIGLKRHNRAQECVCGFPFIDAPDIPAGPDEQGNVGNVWDCDN